MTIWSLTNSLSASIARARARARLYLYGSSFSYRDLCAVSCSEMRRKSGIPRSPSPYFWINRMYKRRHTLYKRATRIGRTLLHPLFIRAQKHSARVSCRIQKNSRNFPFFRQFFFLWVLSDIPLHL